MTTITATTKTGTAFELTNTGTGITARAKGIALGQMDQIDGGIRARFAQNLGGQKVNVEGHFEGAELAKVEALFAEMQRGVEMLAAEQREYDRRYNMIENAR